MCLNFFKQYVVFTDFEYKGPGNRRPLTTPCYVFSRSPLYSWSGSYNFILTLIIDQTLPCGICLACISKDGELHGVYGVPFRVCITHHDNWHWKLNLIIRRGNEWGIQLEFWGLKPLTNLKHLLCYVRTQYSIFHYACKCSTDTVLKRCGYITSCVGEGCNSLNTFMYNSFSLGTGRGLHSPNPGSCIVHM